MSIENSRKGRSLSLQDAKLIARRVRFEYNDWVNKWLGGKEITKSFHGNFLKFSLESRLSRIWFLPRYRGNVIHEPAISEYLLENLGRDSVFFDIGSNIGFFTVLASHLCSEVHAFEMDPRLVVIVRENLRLNQSRAKVRIVNAAVTDKSGSNYQFSPQLESDLLNENITAINKISVVSGPAQVAFFPVSQSIDDYVKRNDVRPNVIKMDIEGAEVFALEGMKDTLKNYRPKLIFEVHPKEIVQFGSTVEKQLNFLRELDYELYHFSRFRNSTELVPLTQTLLEENSAILALPRSS